MPGISISTLAAIRAYGRLSASAAEDLLLSVGIQNTGGVSLDVDSALREIGVDWLSRSATTPSTSAPVQVPAVPRPDWVSHGRPKAKVAARRRFIDVRILNRPRRAATEVLLAGKIVERRESRFRISLRSRLRARHLRMRFLSDQGTSPWTIVPISFRERV